MAIQGIGTGSSPNDGTGDNLRAAGGKINNNFSELYGYFGDGTTLSRGTWNIVSSGINTLSSVGIGTTNPRFTLEVGAVGASGTSLYVNGDARVTGILTVGSSSVTLNGSTNEITVGTGITISGNTGIISATQVTIAGETLTGAGVTSLVAGSNITLSGSTGQVTISSSGVSTDVGAGGTWSNYDGVTGVTTTKKVKIQNDLEVTGVTTSTGGFVGALTGNSTGLTGSPNITVGTVGCGNVTGTGFLSAAAGGGGVGGILVGTSLNLNYQTNTSTILHNNANGQFNIESVSGINLKPGPSNVLVYDTNDVLRFKTTTEGANIYGALSVSSGVSIVGGGVTVTGISTFFVDDSTQNVQFRNTGNTARVAINMENAQTPRIQFISSDNDIASLSGDSNANVVLAAGNTLNLRANTSEAVLQGDGDTGIFASGVEKLTVNSGGISITGTSTCTGSVQVGSGQSFGSSTGSAAVYYGDGSNLTGISGGSGITTANISADTLEVSGVSTFTGNTITNGRVSIGAASAGSANLAIVNTNSASFSIGQNVDGSGANHLGIYYGTGLGSPAGADIFTSNGNMSFWVDGAGGGAGNSELEFGNAFGASGGAGGATWISMSSSGLSVSGIVTARTGAAVTYYGDASYITSGRWVLGANGSTDYTFTGPGFSGATNDPILYLARGQTYEFVNTMNAHPFQIRASNGGSAYNTGVTNNGTQNGTVKFEIPMDAPDTLYYQCTSHSGMGNTISVYPSTI